jgi:hypothetical protein
MPKLTVKISADESGRPTIIDVKGCKVQLNYDAKNSIYSVDFSGRVPSISEILSIVLGLTIQSNIENAVKIKTEAETNILIDKLTQGAYTERRSTLSNDNGVTTPTAPPKQWTNTTFKGKFFPRGCRGIIDTVRVYCKRTGAGTLTVSYAPQAGMGAVGSVTITPGANWGWGLATVYKMWNYDSMFLWVSACSADVSYGCQNVEPFDEALSSDGGVLWTYEDYRLFIRVVMFGETVGDVPVSGIINNIEIPTSVSRKTQSDFIPIESGAEELLVAHEGAGFHEYSIFRSSKADEVGFKVYCDNVLMEYQDGLALSMWGFGSSTPKLSLTQYVAGGTYTVLLTGKYQFKRKFEIKAKNVGAGINSAYMPTSICTLIT